MLGIIFAIMVVVQVGDFIYWILTKLHLTKRYKLSTEAIVKDLGYTMKQYYTVDGLWREVSKEYAIRSQEYLDKTLKKLR